VVAVTGAGGELGRGLLQRLAAAGIEHRPADLLDPQLHQQLSGASTVVHLDVDWDPTSPAAARRTHTVQGTQLVIDAALRAEVPRLVLTTSADVYGSYPDPILDRHPLLGASDAEAIVGDHVEVEGLAEHAARAGLATTVLRPATLVGIGPAYDGQLLRQLGGPRLLAVRGVEPQWQLCHGDDLLAALELAAVGTVHGGLGVACHGAIAQREVEALAGKRRLELPAAVALSTAERLRRVGVTTSSPRELDHLLAPTVLACDGLTAAGWAPTWTNEAALRVHLLERDGDSRAGLAAAGATAAGATAALLGTAALVRSRRRRR
jgi:nucleoside-diphosphate-sugar epimerase